MNRLTLTTLLVALTLVAAGCGAKKEAETSTAAPSAGTSGATATPAVSPYDNGPRAAEGPVDEEQAEQGEKLFTSKGCTACHAFGRRLTGPDLNGVTQRRTAQWMEQQILHPEVMVKQDPISKQLFATYALQMTNQGLTPEQAKAVIEFLKKKNHETAESH